MVHLAALRRLRGNVRQRPDPLLRLPGGPEADELDRGGITAPVDEATPDAAPTCFDIEQATPGGWQPATGVTPNTDGVFS
jgi:hypothetical protein